MVQDPQAPSPDSCFPTVSRVALPILALLVSVLLPTTPTIAEPTWQVHQLTSGSDIDLFPDVSGTTYVWQRRIAGLTAKVMMWSEGQASPTEISDTVYSFAPRINGDCVVWQGKISGSADFETKLWDGGIITALTNNTIDDTNSLGC